MEKIISYDEIPKGNGKSIYLRMNDIDPGLYLTLLNKGYKLINNANFAGKSTIYITGKREYTTSDYEESIELSLEKKGISKPTTYSFQIGDLKNSRYELPFVFKNERQNCGREKFLIQTSDDYKNLLKACKYLIERESITDSNGKKCTIDYKKYLESGFVIQEYINAPSKYNTTVRLITTPSNKLLYGALKYNKPSSYKDETTLIGYLLNDVYPLSTKSIVSNTCRGGNNIILGEKNYTSEEEKLLASHNINSDKFNNLVQASLDTHKEFQSKLGIICGFDYIYDSDKDKWFLLEYHRKPMLGDYSRKNNVDYTTSSDTLIADGRVRATALSLALRK